MRSAVVITALIIAILTIIFNLTFTPSSQRQNIGMHENRKLKINDPYYEQYLKTHTRPSFKEWAKLYGKEYHSEQELLYRMQVYSQNLKEIAQHNILYETGRSTYFKGMNKYGDLTTRQFMQLFNWKHRPNTQITKQCNGNIMDAPNPPVQLDWGNKVSAVGDQGTCGMDWAMVSTDAVASLYALKIGTLPELSTQQLLECSVNYGNEGCDGGFMDQAFAYIIDEGICLASSYAPRYPPTKCKYVLNMKYTTITRCARVPPKKYNKLLSAIVQQPVSVAIDFSPAMILYKGGLFNDSCTSNINHGMLLVGYGGKEEKDFYWRLKNTVGTTWGSGGFINLKRTQSDGDGKCGIMMWPSVPQGIV